MKRLLRAVCLVLCWTLLMAGMPGRASAEEAAPMVRVLLRRLQLTDRADLTLAGAYTVRVGGEDLMALPENAQVTVQIRSGALYLFYDGMSMRLGKSAEFRRNQSGSAMPGLRFEKNGNLYPGSLMLTVENGTLVPILSLSVEDYLLGVVPYEMSDSFPLEALKAQAVCARTYALSHLNASRAYDVVDTTNDQVFKGVDSSPNPPPAPCRRRRGLSACTTASWRNAFTAPATADRRNWLKMCGRAAATTATTQWLMTHMIWRPRRASSAR